MFWIVPFLLAAGSAQFITVPSGSQSSNPATLIEPPTNVDFSDDSILEKRYTVTEELCKTYYTDCKIFNKSGTPSEKQTCAFMDKKCFPRWGQWHASEVQYSKTHKAPPPPKATPAPPPAPTPNDAKAAGKGFTRVNMHQWVNPATGHWSTTWWVFDSNNNIISGPVTNTAMPDTLGIPITGPGFDNLWAYILNPGVVANSENNIWFNYQKDNLHVNKFSTNSKSAPGIDGSLHNKDANACFWWHWYAGATSPSWYRNIDCYFHTKCGPNGLG